MFIPFEEGREEGTPLQESRRSAHKESVGLMIQ